MTKPLDLDDLLALEDTCTVGAGVRSAAKTAKSRSPSSALPSGAVTKAVECPSYQGDTEVSSRIVFRPPERPNLVGPLIFLAGPIQGALDWQSAAIDLLGVLTPSTHVASPRRPVFGPDDFDDQVLWETIHLDRAGVSGVILFWLEREYEHFCERAYAQTSRFELGEWLANQAYSDSFEPARVVVGIDKDFSGGRYIRSRLINSYPKVEVCSTLEQTCSAAANLIIKEMSRASD